MMNLEELKQRWRDRTNRAVGAVRARYWLADCERDGWVCATGSVTVQAARGAVVIGRNAVLCGGLVPIELIASGRARIHIGASSVVNYGTRIAALGADIVMGQRCLVASGVRILACGPRATVIGDDVWIAHGAVIESGVRIGAGSVISAATVVSADVPPHSLVIGDPPRAVPLRLMEAPPKPAKVVWLPGPTARAVLGAARAVKARMRRGHLDNRRSG